MHCNLADRFERHRQQQAEAGLQVGAGQLAAVGAAEPGDPNIKSSDNITTHTLQIPN